MRVCVLQWDAVIVSTRGTTFHVCSSAFFKNLPANWHTFYAWCSTVSLEISFCPGGKGGMEKGG